MLEHDLSIIKGYVSAALHIRATFARIIDGFSVHRDAHEIQSKRIGRLHLTDKRCDFHPLVVVEDHQIVIDYMHFDSRSIGLDKAGIDNVVRLDIAAAVEFRLPLAQLHLLDNGGHGTPCARHGQTNVIPVNSSGTPIKAFVVGIANKPQTNIRFMFDFNHGTAQHISVTFWYYRLPFIKEDRFDAA